MRVGPLDEAPTEHVLHSENILDTNVVVLISAIFYIIVYAFLL